MAASSDAGGVTMEMCELAFNLGSEMEMNEMNANVCDDQMVFPPIPPNSSYS